MSGFCISGEYLSISVIFRPLRSSGSVTREVMTACGAEPVPTLWRPSIFQVDEGVHAVVLRDDHGKAADHILQSRQALFFTWSLPFMPSLAVQPPAVTTTVW